MKKTLIIYCPNCSYEYLPAEIFHPKTILGHPRNIIRDEKGKIEFFEGSNMELKEKFICYNCNKEFTIKINVSFNTKIKVDKINFDEDYVTVLN